MKLFGIIVGAILTAVVTIVGSYNLWVANQERQAARLAKAKETLIKACEARLTEDMRETHKGWERQRERGVAEKPHLADVLVKSDFSEPGYFEPRRAEQAKDGYWIAQTTFIWPNRLTTRQFMAFCDFDKDGRITKVASE